MSIFRVLLAVAGGFLFGFTIRHRGPMMDIGTGVGGAMVAIALFAWPE